MATKKSNINQLLEESIQMPKTGWLKSLRLNIHAPGTGLALMVIALTQVPVAIKTTAEIYCMEKVGQRQGSAVEAIIKCNGG